MSDKYCTDCKWCKKDDIYTCVKPEIDLVSGAEYSMDRSCVAQRYEASRTYGLVCGLEGKYYDES